MKTPNHVYIHLNDCPVISYYWQVWRNKCNFKRNPIIAVLHRTLGEFRSSRIRLPDPEKPGKTSSIPESFRISGSSSSRCRESSPDSEIILPYPRFSFVMAHTTTSVPLKVGPKFLDMEAKSLPGKRRRTFYSFWGPVVLDFSWMFP
jgi:hypothetical protein